MSTKIMSTRIDNIYAKEITRFAKNDGLDKSSFLQKLIIQGLNDYKLNYAITLYNEKKISLSRAAEIANISQYEFISIMPDKHMALHYSSKDFDEDVALKI
ncbi:MAG TPA: hypothetical protein DC049_08555 [Spirochaetia bacterium]|nr:hypothetical protein [Spirochaetia bacterium]